MIPLRLEKKPARKFKNVPVVVDGIRFASGREAFRYCELKVSEQSGFISCLQRQVRYPLHVEGVKIGHYVSDFDYFDCSTQTPISEDIKGVLTPMFKWKAKHFAIEYGREIRVTK